MGNFADAFKTAYEDERVQSALSKWNTWRDSRSNLLSESTQQFVKSNSFIPESVKLGYEQVVSKANGLTAGLASSNILTKGLRYQNVINKGIDVGLSATEKVAVRLNEMEDKVNEKIDDKLEEVRSERELPVIKESEADTGADYYPGSKRFAY